MGEYERENGQRHKKLEMVFTLGLISPNETVFLKQYFCFSFTFPYGLYDISASPLMVNPGPFFLNAISILSLWQWWTTSGPLWQDNSYHCG